VASVIQLRKDLAAVWALVNPILADGELGYERDTNQFKVGDGASPWNDLPYGGIKGDKGDVGSDLNYVHNQSVAESEWLITHNLDKYPSVTIVDSTNDECEGNVLHVSTNQVLITFSAPFAGRAFLN
jgi:hypothetical protein